MRTVLTPLALLSTLLFAACDTEESVDGGTVSWDLAGLEHLGEGFVYEGWVIVDGEALSTGRFGLDQDGVPELSMFVLTPEQVEGAEAFVLSIEPDTGDAPEPSAVKILGGDLMDGEADLSIAHPSALGTDLADAVAPYILETPTSLMVAEDYNQGVWWVVPGGGGSADLPALPEGWIYEGWAVAGGEVISTGTFSGGAEVDSDGAGPDAGPDGAPPFPGQDFIDPAVDLIGGRIVISVEPVPDDSPSPFVLKPLTDDVEDVGAGVPQDMTNQALANAPTGFARIE